MRRIFPLFLLAVLAANAAPQSGRRGVTKPPPPPPERLSEPPIVVSQPESAPATLAELGGLPESVLTRQLQALGKGSFSLADFGGKVVVVNLWASWCGPCRMEVPEYEKVRKD